MATNQSGNRNIEARLVMDSTGNWKLIANAAPPGVEPSHRRQLLKVTGPDGKIKFFYGNKPEEGGLNPILKQASPTTEIKSKPDENKRLLTESQAKSLAMLLSSVKSQMTSSSSSVTSQVTGIQATPQTAVSSGIKQISIPATASTTSVVAQGPSSLGHGQSNQLVLLVTAGNKNALAKTLQASVPPADVAPRIMKPRSNLVCGNSGTPRHLKPKTVYVIKQAPLTQPTLSTNKKFLSSIHESQHGRIDGRDSNYQVLSHLLNTNDGMSVSKDASPTSSGTANVKQVVIPSTASNPYTLNTDRYVDPILSRFDTTSSIPYAAASTSAPIQVSESVGVPAVKLGMPLPPLPPISFGNAATPNSQLVFMPTYFMPTLVTPTATASATPFEQCSVSAGPTQSNVAITVPGQRKLIMPTTTNTTDPVNRCNKVSGSQLASNKSVKDLLNELARERENKKEVRNDTPGVSLKGNDNCTEGTRSTLRIESVFSLQHTEENLEADQKIEVNTEVECVRDEAKDSGSGISSSTENCGSAKEASNMAEDRLIKQEQIRQRSTKPIVMANKFRHRLFPKKVRLKYHMLEPFVVLERVDGLGQTSSESVDMEISKTSALQNTHSCSRLCREKRLMKLCGEKRIPCINRLKSEVLSTAKKCRKIRRKVRKSAPLENGEQVKTPSSPFDVFLKNLVEKERKRHEKNTNKKAPSTSADNVSHPRRYLSYNTLGKHIRVGRYRVIVPKNSEVVETFQLKSVVPKDADILPPVPVPAAFEDIVDAEDVVDAEEVQPTSTEPGTTELGGDEPEVANPESPSSETETGSSETCSDGNISDALDCEKEHSDECDPIFDKHEQSDQEGVQSESGRDSPDDVSASKSDEEQERVEMDTNPETDEATDAEIIPVVDTSTLINDSADTDDTLDLHQSDVTTSINDDSDAVISDDEVSDLKAVETPPKEEESDDDWGTTELEVDPDSEHEEDMDIMFSGLPPIVTESLPEPDEEVGNGCLAYPSENIGNHSANIGNTSANIGNSSANIGGNDRIQRLKAQLEEQTRKVDSIRRVRSTR